MKYLAPALTGLLVLTACGGGGSSDSNASADRQEEMVATLVRHGLDSELASCVADGLSLRLPPNMYAEVISAENSTDVPQAWQPVVAGTTDDCAAGGGIGNQAVATNSDTGRPAANPTPETPTAPVVDEP